MKKLTFLFIFSLISNFIEAQNFIIAGNIADSNYYYNIIPDRHMQTYHYEEVDLFSIDINNDTLIDLTFRLHNWFPDGPLGIMESTLLIESINNCKVGIKRIDTTFCSAASWPDTAIYVANLFNQGDTIDNSMFCYHNRAYIYERISSTAYHCPFKELLDWRNIQNNKYLPVQINEKYGWIQVRPYCLSDYQITLFDYAFQIDENNSLNNVTKNLFKIYPNPSKKKFRIFFENFDYTSSKIIIYNFLGIEIINQELTIDNKDFEISEPGIYFVQIRNKNSFTTKKIIIE